MKTNSKKLALILFFVTNCIFSQNSDFNPLVKELAQSIATIEDTKSTITQSITSDNPGILKFTSNETSVKGKNNEIISEFNLTDIDINTIKPIVSKDRINVQLIVSRNQKMIKQTTNNEKTSYVSDLEILATNIDNARELVKYLKQLVPISNKITDERLSLKSYAEKLDWLKKNIISVDLIDKRYEQSFTENATSVGNVTFVNTASNGKSSKTNGYQFNLANINPKTINFKSKGDEFILNLETKRGLKTIKSFVDQVPKSYTNDFEIICSSVENARDLQRVLQEIIPLAKEKFENSLPTISSVANGLELINQKIKTINSDKLTTDQLFSDDCITSFTKTEQSEKKTDEHLYNFNFIDINNRTIDIEIKGSNIYVVLQTLNKNKFIKYLKNQELQSYTNIIKLASTNVDDAIITQKIIQKIIDLCHDKMKNTVSISSKNNGIDLLEQNIKSVKQGKITYEQKLESIENSNNKTLKLTTIKVSDKKSDENINEFNLSDINPKSIFTKISGKNVTVEFSTNYQEKIIKTYVNGEIKNYTNKGLIFCDDIENARKIATLLKLVTLK